MALPCLALPRLAARPTTQAAHRGSEGPTYSRLFYVPQHAVLCVLCVAATHAEHQASWRCRAPKLAYSADTPQSTLVTVDQVESHTTAAAPVATKSFSSPHAQPHGTEYQPRAPMHLEAPHDQTRLLPPSTAAAGVARLRLGGAPVARLGGVSGPTQRKGDECLSQTNKQTNKR